MIEAFTCTADSRISARPVRSPTSPLTNAHVVCCELLRANPFF